MHIARLTNLSWLMVAILALGLVQARPAAAADSEMEASVRQTLNSLYESQPSAKEFARRAQAMLVFPRFGRGGFILGGGFGRGVMVEGGKIVDDYRMTSGSIGLQAGYQERDQVIMFMTQDALKQFRASDGWQLGIDGSFTLIDAGQGGDVAAKGAVEDVVVFVNNLRGLMVSLALQGSRIVRAE